MLTPPYSTTRISLGEDISAPVSRLINLVFALTTLKKLQWVKGKFLGDLECRLSDGTTLEFRSPDTEHMGIVVDLVARTSMGFELTVESSILPSSLKPVLLRAYYEARMVAYSDEQNEETGQLDLLNRNSIYQVLASLQSVPISS